MQEEGSFIVTFPGAYHCGFNTGLNCAEAVNFAPPDWLRFAAASAERYRAFNKPPVISQEELLICAAKENPGTETAKYAERELDRLIQEEMQLRFGGWAIGELQLCVSGIGSGVVP